MNTIFLPPNVLKRIKKHEYLKGLDMEKLKDNPICPRCERVALRDIGYQSEKIATCPHCGYKGRMTTTLSQYAAGEFYK